MKIVKTSSYVWVWIGVGVFLLFVFALQIFLTLHQQYPAAVSDEFTEKTRSFVDEAQRVLEAQQAQSSQSTP